MRASARTEKRDLRLTPRAKRVLHPPPQRASNYAAGPKNSIFPEELPFSNPRTGSKNLQGARIPPPAVLLSQPH